MSTRPQRKPRWQHRRFDNHDVDPLSGFANIMDVMLVFALGLIIALISQSDDLKRHFGLEQVTVTTSEELIDLPEQLQGQGSENQGMVSVGKVYRDEKTGKLILIGD